MTRNERDLQPNLEVFRQAQQDGELDLRVTVPMVGQNDLQVQLGRHIGNVSDQYALQKRMEPLPDVSSGQKDALMFSDFAGLADAGHVRQQELFEVEVTPSETKVQPKLGRSSEVQLEVDKNKAIIDRLKRLGFQLKS